MIYAHLWTRADAAATSPRPENSEAKWFIPCIVGAQFANEAFQWYYSHGYMGAEIPICQLDDWLHGTSRYVGVKPMDYKIRTLKVLVDKGTTDAVLDTLFNITRIRGFELNIRFNFEFERSIDLLWLTERGSYLAQVIARFREEGDKVELEMEIKQTLRRQPVRATGPLFFHRLEGQDSEDMLIAEYKEW
jgi:hypothetical protein